MTTGTRDRPTSSAGPVAHRYPPLASVLVAMLLAAFVLPSALSVPQAPPSSTVEFAPVLSADESPPPHRPDGALSDVGLGVSAGPATGPAAGPPGAAPAPGAPPPPGGVAGRPVAKRCVGDPPRQTEDPLSPPCVAHFEGDNRGATFGGVEGDEIRVLFYLDGNDFYGGQRGREQGSPGTYVDLSQPPEDDEFIFTRYLRVWQHYFNDRYQTYGRTVRFHLYYATRPQTPETRRADAAANIAAVDPLAVIPGYVVQGFLTDYLDAVTRADRMFFTDLPLLATAFYRDRAPLLWGYNPSLEVSADHFSSYLCTRVAPYPVSSSGADHLGQPRRYGLIYTDDPRYPQETAYKDRVVEAVADCGIEFAEDSAFPVSNNTVSRHRDDYSVEAMARFSQAGVTTIIWAAGMETNYSSAAAALNYEPEWIIGGSGFNEANDVAQQQDQRSWSHAWVVTNVARALEQGYGEDCVRAYESTGESFPGTPPAEGAGACWFYRSLRQLFTGIQVAGPVLTPRRVDLGFHAIPPYRSDDPFSPACFYAPGDYTCVGDATAMWWDPIGQCWRMPLEGRRYQSATWPQADIAAERTADDPCNQHAAGSSVAPLS